MKQKHVAMIIAGLTLIFGMTLWREGLIRISALTFVPDRIAIISHYLSNGTVTAFKIYTLSIFVFLGPLLLAVLPELEMRKKDDTAFTLVTHLVIVAFAVIILSLAIHSVANLLLKKSVAIHPIDAVMIPIMFTGVYATIRICFWQKPVNGKDTLSRGIEVIFDADRAERILAHKSSKLKANGISLHDAFKIPISQETKHTLLIAAPGAGKTQVIYPLVERIRERGDALLIYDFKGDFTAAFGEDQGVIILSPFDDRGYGWDIAADINTDLKALEFAACLLPDHTAKEPFFKKAAQDLLAGVITRLIIERHKDWTIGDLVRILNDKTEIVASCETYRPAALSALGPVDEKQASGVFGELRTGSIQLEYLARAWPAGHPKISLVSWVRDLELRNKIPVIMLRGHQQYRKLDGFLTSLVCSLLIKEALSLPDSYERRIWTILDEFGNLPKIDGIDALLTGVRSKGVRIVAALQDIAQIEETYSRYFAQTFFNCFGTVLAGLCSGATARYLSDAFGKNKIERLQTSRSRNRSTKNLAGGISVSESEQSLIENALIDTDFSNLPPPSLTSPASFWLRISGWPIARLAFPVRPLPIKYLSHVEPAWFGAVVSAGKAEVPERTDNHDEVTDDAKKPSHKDDTSKTDCSLSGLPDLVRQYRPQFGTRPEAGNGGVP